MEPPKEAKIAPASYIEGSNSNIHHQPPCMKSGGARKPVLHLQSTKWMANHLLPHQYFALNLYFDSVHR